MKQLCSLNLRKEQYLSVDMNQIARNHAKLRELFHEWMTALLLGCVSNDKREE